MLNPSTFQKSNWRHLSLAAALFFLPLQFGVLLVQPEWARGFFNPYISTQLHLFQLLLVLSAGFTLLEWEKLKWKKSIHLWITLAVLVFLGLNTLALPWQISQIFFLLLLLLLVTEKDAQKNQKIYLQAFIFSATLQALLAVVQFLFLQSPEVLHQAKFSLAGFEMVRSYGSFTHPNILAAYLGLALLLLPQLKLKRTWHLATLSILALGLLFSFSRLSIVALAFSILPFLKSKKSLALVLSPLILILILRPFTLQDAALIERFEAYRLALRLWLESPLIGHGLGSFTQKMDTFANLRPWEYQVAHNIPLLLLAETGFIGFLGFILLCLYAFKVTKSKQQKIFLLFILIAALGDHYWLTSSVASTSLLFALFIKKKDLNSKSLLGLE